MTLTPVRLHSWLRLQREGVSLAARADALCRALQDCPEVRRAVYLSWQPQARIYSHEGAAQHLRAAAPTGDQTDADLDQTDIGFGMRLHGRTMQRDLAAAAKRHAGGRGFRRQAD